MVMRVDPLNYLRKCWERVKPYNINICLFALFTSKACMLKGGMITSIPWKRCAWYEHWAWKPCLHGWSTWSCGIKLRGLLNQNRIQLLRALLGACAYHGNLEIGRELSCREALRWDQNMNKHGGYWSNMIEHNSRSVIHHINITFDNYVILSNMHARNGILRSKLMCIVVLLQFCKYYNNAGGQKFFLSSELFNPGVKICQKKSVFAGLFHQPMLDSRNHQLSPQHHIMNLVLFFLQWPFKSLVGLQAVSWCIDKEIWTRFHQWWILLKERGGG